MLEATVNEFNAAVNDKEFDLISLDGKATVGLSPNKTNWANPSANLRSSESRYVALCVHLWWFEDGLRLSSSQYECGVPIPGLYVARELTGLFYHEYPPATSCLRSMAFGREAGMAIAKLGKGVQAGKTNGKL